MTSESIRIEQQYPAGHHDRHTPHLCPDCGSPLTVDGRCTRCARAAPAERLVLHFPDRATRLERMERAAACDAVLPAADRVTGFCAAGGRAMTFVWFVIWLIANNVGGHEPLLLDPVNAWMGTLILAIALDLGGNHAARGRSGGLNVAAPAPAPPRGRCVSPMSAVRRRVEDERRCRNANSARSDVPPRRT